MAVSDIIWNAIPDTFRNLIFRGEGQRVPEGLWVAMRQLAADTIEIEKFLGRTNSPMTIDWVRPNGYTPLDASKIQNRSTLDVEVLGIRQETVPVWWIIVDTNTIDDIPQEGYLRAGTQLIHFDDAATLELQDGRYLLKIPTDSTESPPWEDDLASALFDADTDLSGADRFDQVTGAPASPSQNGVEFSVSAVDFMALDDNAQVPAGDSWRNTWLVDITEWDEFPASTTQTRHISLQSSGDVGQDVEIRIEQTSNSNLEVKFGHLGSLQSKTPLREQVWLETLRNSSIQGPTTIEVELRYDAVNRKMSGYIRMLDEEVGFSNAASVRPGKREHQFAIHNGIGTTEGYIRAAIVPGQQKWSSPRIDIEQILSPSFPYRYDVDDDLESVSTIRNNPWPLAPTGSIQVSDNTVSVHLDPGYNNWTPDHARIWSRNGGWAIIKKTSQTDSEAEYEITHKSDTSLSWPSNIQLHPWYLGSEEYEINDGVLSTAYPVPQPEQAWGIEGRISDVNLYDRFGKLFELPDHMDSPAYLGWIRGMHIARKLPPRPQNIQQALQAVFGLPYTPDGGLVQSIERRDDEDVIVLDGEEYRIDTSWRDQGLLPGENERLDPFEPIVDGIQVNDWVNGDPPSYLGDWEKFGTVWVQIPAIVGISVDELRVTRQLLRESIPSNLAFQIEPTTSIDENNQQHLTAQEGAQSQTGNKEDLVFGEEHPVVVHRGEPSAGHPADTYLSHEPDTMSGFGMDTEGRSLGAMFTKRWLRYTNDKGRTTIDPEDVLDDPSLRTTGPHLETMNLLRDPSDAEDDLGLSGTPPRTSDTAVYPDGQNAKIAVPRRPSVLWEAYQFSTPWEDPVITFAIDAASDAQAAWNNFVESGLDTAASNHAGSMAETRVVSFNSNSGIVEHLAMGNNTAGDLQSAFDSVSFGGDRTIFDGVEAFFDERDTLPKRDNIVVLIAAGNDQASSNDSGVKDKIEDASGHIDCIATTATTSDLDDLHHDGDAYTASSSSDIDTSVSSILSDTRWRLMRYKHREWQTESSPDGNNIDAVDATRQEWTVATDLNVYQSSDQGESWSLVFDGNNINLTTQWRDSEKGWVVGDASAVIDQDQNSVSVASPFDFLEITWDQQTGYILAEDGSGNHWIYETTDGGNTWTDVLSGFDKLSSLETTGGDLFAVGESGGVEGDILKLDSDAYDMTSLYEGGMVSMNTAGRFIYGVSSQDEVAISRDSGQTWTEIDDTILPDGQKRLEIESINRLYCLVEDPANKVFASYDGGESWIEVYSHANTLNDLSVRMWNNQPMLAGGQGDLAVWK